VKKYYLFYFKHKVICAIFIISTKLIGSSSGMMENLEENIFIDLKERVNLKYNINPIAAILAPESTSYITINNQSTIHDLYEIGSITKFFTAHLALLLVEEGKINLHQPIETFIAEIFPNAHESLKNKSLYQLLTHTTGLKDPKQNSYYNKLSGNTLPIVDYDMSDIDKFLSTQKLPPDVERPIYSNLGYGLIGLILEKVSGKSYGILLHEYILRPLNMKETFIEMPKNSSNRKVVGYCQGVPVPHWNIKYLKAFASIVSSLHDLSIYFNYIAFSDFKNSEIAKKLEKTPYSLGKFRIKFGMGWSMDMRYEGKINVLTGRTLGFSSFIGWNKESSRLVILLVDSDTFGLTAHRWFNPSIPKDRLNKQITLPIKTLKSLEGKYRLQGEENIILVVQATETHLKIYCENEPPTILYPSDNGYFFTKQLYDSSSSMIFFKEKKGKLSIYESSENKIQIIGERIK